ncbi:transposase [Streptomyces sp. NPDC058239]|uniref:transposase n=1 Tax=unclassified Streptomyces TaxID=2593676 RepID=UPI00364DFA59
MAVEHARERPTAEAATAPVPTTFPKVRLLIISILPVKPRPPGSRVASTVNARIPLPCPAAVTSPVTGTSGHRPKAVRLRKWTARAATSAGPTTRRARCRVPDGERHRPKWQLALDMLDELAAVGLRPAVPVADTGYGDR